MRPATDTDFDTAYEIYMDVTVNPFMSYEMLDKDGFKEVFTQLKARDYFWIFEHDGTPYGMCTVTQGKARASEAAYLGSLGIKSTLQGKGLGRKMMQNVEEFLKKEGFKVVYFMVEADNDRGVRFYEALGFQKGGVVPGYFKRQNEDTRIDEFIYYKTFN